MSNSKQLETIVRSMTGASDELIAGFLDMGTFRNVSNNEALFRAGRPVTSLLFLEKGLLRAYRIIDGTEYTHFFFTEHWFATDYRSFLTESPGELQIEALTETSFYEFDKTALLNFWAQHPQFEKLGRIIAEEAYLKMVERLVDFQTQSLKERYLRLIERSPNLFQIVPQRFIASYLGVTEQSLSRIKAQAN